MHQNRNWKVGGRVEFRRTTGDCISGRTFGVILMIGRSAGNGWGDDRVVDGAVVAWEADRYDSETYPAHVSFTPFWNQRFQSLETE